MTFADPNDALAAMQLDATDPRVFFQANTSADRSRVSSGEASVWSVT